MPRLEKVAKTWTYATRLVRYVQRMFPLSNAFLNCEKLYFRVIDFKGSIEIIMIHERQDHAKSTIGEG
jgi:hypothetical protein